jgi:tryptophanase
MANIGGFLCANDDKLAQQEKDLLILTEGYPTYGGLAGRDLEAIAVGIQEALHEDYLRYRIASTAYLGNHIAEQVVPIEIGTLMFGAAAKMDLVRLAIPRRVYTQSHVDYVVEVILEVWKNRDRIQGLKLSHEAPFLRHFTARLEPVERVLARLS